MKYLPLLVLATQTAVAQSVWTADFVQSKLGRQAQALQYFEQNWSEARKRAKEAGYVGRYQLLQVRPDTSARQDFDIILLTEYPSEAVYEHREANFQTIFRSMSRRQPANGMAPVDMRDIRFTRTFMEPLANQHADSDLEATLRDYLDGGTFGDTTRLIRAFHPSASMKFVDKTTGQFKDVPIATYLNGARANAGKRSDRTTRIVHYEKSGTAAQARVESDYPTFRFIDFFNLLQIDGRWQIVSKIFYREDKPTAAK